MKRFLSLMLCLAMVAAASTAFAATSGAADRDTGEYQVAVPGDGVILTSSTSSQALAARETAGPDTFVLYGGPDPGNLEGKFELANGVSPDWGDGSGVPSAFGAGAWTPVDLTDQPVYWHQDTFNMENLNGNGAGNQGMWSGVAAGDPLAATWVSAQGYGNNWSDALLYESAPLADPSQGEVVSLDFFFNHDTEPGFDFFSVQYDSAGNWTTVYTTDASNADTLGVFQAPGVQYSAVATTPITYSGNDFGGDNGDQIRIRLIVESDGAWSDEDGLWPTAAGAAQVDDISLITSQVNTTEDFEGAGPYLFFPDKAPFAGDFAEAYPRLTDIDPCRDNLTPVIGFIDYNQIVRNGPALDGVTFQTGGSTSAGINYGITGNFVSNYTGGLSFGQANVTNEIWSPEITWDLAGTGDDAVDIAGSFIRFTAWNHLPLINGYFYLWHVRSALPGDNFDSWTDRNFVYYGGTPTWQNQVFDTSDIIQAGPEKVQMALAAWDYASVFGFPGTAATPSPVFDNAAFYKYRVGGPTFATRTIDTANDGFPVNGSIDVSTQATRNALDIPFDMARDVNSGDFVNEPGDSVIVDVASVIPGAAVTDIRMVWALNRNPTFEDAIRNTAWRAKDEALSTPAFPTTLWTGEVVADTSTTSAGAKVADRFFVDLPDQDLIYPGDVLHYYIQATDSDGRTTTLPGDTTDFLNFDNGTKYNRLWTVRGLPTIKDTAGAQPSILVYNDFGRRGGENEWVTALAQLGYAEGVDYDSYTVQGPSSGVSNGIGSSGAHGATPAQLAGYNHMFYFLGNLSTQSISNGDATLSGNDKSNDIDVLEQWHALAGVRNMAYFGDNIGSAVSGDSPAGLNYVTNTMGVDVLGPDVRPVIGGQTAAKVVPNGGGAYAANFATEFIAYGGCLAVNTFDQIQPLSGADSGHYFTDTNGAPITDALAGVASVINPTANGLDMTFPFGNYYIYDVVGRAPVNLSARALLFQEILGLFNAPGPGSPITAAPSVRNAELSVVPNPFNPMTTVKFTAALGSKGSVKVFNLRGELVKTLHTGEFQTQSFTWDGTDNRGASVASGVYVVQAEANGQVQTKKAALVK